MNWLAAVLVLCCSLPCTFSAALAATSTQGAAVHTAQGESGRTDVSTAYPRAASNLYGVHAPTILGSWLPRRLQSDLQPMACLPHACFTPATLVLDLTLPGNTSSVVMLSGSVVASGFILSTMRRPGLEISDLGGGRLRFAAVSSELSPGLHTMHVWAVPLQQGTQGAVSNTSQAGTTSPLLLPVSLAVQVLVRAPLLTLIPSPALGAMVLPNGTTTAAVDLHNEGLADLVWNITLAGPTSLLNSTTSAVPSFKFFKFLDGAAGDGATRYRTGCDFDSSVSACNCNSWAAGVLRPGSSSSVRLVVAAGTAPPGTYSLPLQIRTNEGMHIPDSIPPSVVELRSGTFSGRVRMLPLNVRVNNLWVCPTSMNTVLFPLGNYSTTVSMFSIDASEQQRLELDTQNTQPWLSVFGAPELLPLQATPISLSLFVIADAEKTSFPLGSGDYSTSLRVLACPAALSAPGALCRDAPPGSTQEQEVQLQVSIQPGTPSLAKSSVQYDTVSGGGGSRALQGGGSGMQLAATDSIAVKVFLRDAWEQPTSRDSGSVQHTLYFKPTAVSSWEPVQTPGAVTSQPVAADGGGVGEITPPSLLFSVSGAQIASSTGFVSLQVLYRGQAMRGGGLGQLVALRPAQCDPATQVRTADGVTCLCKSGMQPAAAAGGAFGVLGAAASGTTGLAAFVRAGLPCVSCPTGFARLDPAADAAMASISAGAGVSSANTSLAEVPATFNTAPSLTVQAQLCSACLGTTFAHTGASVCQSCPARGAVCSGGTVQLKSGWWVPASVRTEDIRADTQIYPCINTDACGLPGATNTGVFAVGTNTSTVPSLVLCSEGYEGPLCFACQTGWLKVFGSCVPCWSRAAAAAACVAVVCVSLLWPLASLLLATSTERQRGQPHSWWGASRFKQGGGRIVTVPALLCFKLVPRKLTEQEQAPLSAAAAISEAAHFAAVDSLAVSMRLFWQWAQLFAVLSTALEVSVPAGAGRVLEALGAWGDVFGLDLLNWVCVWPRPGEEGGGASTPPSTGEAPAEQGTNVYNSVFWSVFWGVGLPTFVLLVSLAGAWAHRLSLCGWRGQRQHSRQSGGSAATAAPTPDSYVPPQAAGGRSEHREARNAAFTALAWVLFGLALAGALLGTAYSTVTRTVFSTFDTLSVQIQGETLLRSDVTLSTGDVQYTGVFITAVVFGVVFLAAWPVLIVRLATVAAEPAPTSASPPSPPMRLLCCCCCMRRDVSGVARDKMVMAQRAQASSGGQGIGGVFALGAQAFTRLAAAGLHADGTHRGTLQAVQSTPEAHIHPSPLEAEHEIVWNEQRLFHTAAQLQAKAAGAVAQGGAGAGGVTVAAKSLVLSPSCFQESRHPHARYWWIVLEYGRFLLVAGVGAFMTHANEQLLALSGWLLGYTLLLVALEPYSTARANIMGITGSIAQLLVALGLHYLFTAARAAEESTGGGGGAGGAASGVAASVAGRSYREDVSTTILFVLVFAVVLLFAWNIFVDTLRVLLGPAAVESLGSAMPSQLRGALGLPAATKPCSAALAKAAATLGKAQTPRPAAKEQTVGKGPNAQAHSEHKAERKRQRSVQKMDSQAVPVVEVDTPESLEPPLTPLHGSFDTPGDAVVVRSPLVCLLGQRQTSSQ
mgnify:CR=1 FL=1